MSSYLQSVFPNKYRPTLTWPRVFIGALVLVVTAVVIESPKSSQFHMFDEVYVHMVYSGYPKADWGHGYEIWGKPLQDKESSQNIFYVQSKEDAKPTQIVVQKSDRITFLLGHRRKIAVLAAHPAGNDFGIYAFHLKSRALVRLDAGLKGRLDQKNFDFEWHSRGRILSADDQFVLFCYARQNWQRLPLDGASVNESPWPGKVYFVVRTDDGTLEGEYDEDSVPDFGWNQTLEGKHRSAKGWEFADWLGQNAGWVYIQDGYRIWETPRNENASRKNFILLKGEKKPRQYYESQGFSTSALMSHDKSQILINDAVGKRSTEIWIVDLKTNKRRRIDEGPSNAHREASPYGWYKHFIWKSGALAFSQDDSKVLIQRKIVYGAWWREDDKKNKPVPQDEYFVIQLETGEVVKKYKLHDLPAKWYQ